MKPVYLTSVLAGAFLLSACGKKSENAAPEQPTATSPPADMGKMEMPAGAKMAKSTGTVAGVDKAAGKITLAHAAIPEVNWPAMTMTFSIKPELLKDVAVGDKVAFDVTIAGNAGEVTAISKQ